MLTRLTQALTASRLRRMNGEAGFTLIELLVVVLIIGILSAIAIPIFLGQQNQAKEAATKSDLSNLKTAVVSYATAHDGTWPANGDGAALAQVGYVQSENTEWMSIISASSAGMCLSARSVTGTTFYITNKKGVYTVGGSNVACT